MKNFLCLLLILGIIFATGCQNPLGGIDEVKSRIESIKTSSEQNSTKDPEGNKVTDNNGDNSTKDAENETKVKETVSLQVDRNVKNTGSNGKTTAETLSITAYYQDADGKLIPVTRDIEKEEGIAKAAIRSMVDNEENRKALKTLGLYPVLPKGTEIMGISIKDGTAVIDFNNKLLDYKTKLEERNIFSAIVYTLTEFKTITGVKILVNGYKKDKLKYSGNISGTLGRKNTLINSDKLNLESKTLKLDVYLFKYLDDKYEYLLPVSMQCLGISDDMLPEQIVRSLSKKPQDKNLFTQMPENVELVDYSIEDKLVTLDFGKEIKNYGGTAREEGLLKQLLYTMKQIDGAEKVRILIEGKKDDLPEGTDISKDLLLPSKINKVSDNKLSGNKNNIELN